MALFSLLAACNADVPPSQPAGSASPAAVSSGLPTSPVSGSFAPGTPASGSAAPGSPGPGPGQPTPLPVPPEQGGPAFTPPPEMEPQADEVCLAIVTREEAADALGQPVGDIVAQASDPSIQLSCAYRVAGTGALLLTIASESVDSAFDGELAIADGQGQTAELLDGLGERAFYAAASASAPQQIVFTKGPAVVRVWNQAGRAMDRDAFVTLAGIADGRIEAEVRPAP